MYLEHPAKVKQCPREGKVAAAPTLRPWNWGAVWVSGRTSVLIHPIYASALAPLRKLWFASVGRSAATASVLAACEKPSTDVSFSMLVRRVCA